MMTLKQSTPPNVTEGVLLVRCMPFEINRLKTGILMRVTKRCSDVISESRRVRTV